MSDQWNAPAYQPPTAGTEAPYSVGDAVGYGWRKFADNAGPIIGYGALLAIPIIALYGLLIGVYISSSTTTTDPVTGVSTRSMNLSAGSGVVLALGYIALFLLATVLSVGIIRATARVLDGQSFGLSDLLSLDRVGTAFVTSLLVGLGTALGIVLCVIPGIAFAFLSYYAVWFVVDKGESPMTAIKSSIAMVRANVGNAILLALLVFGISLLGELACGVGLLVAIPVSQIAIGYSFRRFQGDAVVA